MDIFTALAEPTRRQIIEIIATNGQVSATHIYEHFEVSAPAISQHLKVLKDSNLVIVEKHAQQRLYQINPDSMDELEKWAQKMKNLWNSRFDRLEKLLEKQQKSKKVLEVKSKTKS